MSDGKSKPSISGEPPLDPTEVGRRWLAETESRAQRQKQELVDLAARDVAKWFLRPRYLRDGRESVRLLIEEKSSVRGLSSCLAALARALDIDLAEFFSEEEIIDAALAYLANLGDSSRIEHSWAWLEFDSCGERSSAEEHLAMVLRLIEKAPEDEGQLWMIGDGPLSTLGERERCDMAKRLDQLELSNPKLARIGKILDEHP